MFNYPISMYFCNSPFNIIPAIYTWIFQVVPVLQFSPPKLCMHFFLIRATCPARLFLLEDLFSLMEKVKLLSFETR
jgi:hypothetical protein